MRNYSIVDYPKDAKLAFNFLVWLYNFILVEDTEKDLSYLLKYVKRDIKVVLNYDYRDNFFYFYVTKRDVNYSDKSNEFIRPFFKLVPGNSEIENQLQPDDLQYLEALKRNAEVLRLYAVPVLEGKEWF